LNLAQRAYAATAWLATAAVFTVLLVPFRPGLPAATALDHSWIIGLNEAMRLGLDFGTEVVFTFGPYASVYTQEWSSSTDGLMLFGAGVLALGYATLFGILGAQRGRLLVIALALAVLLVLRQKDAMLFLYPLAFAIYLSAAFLSSDTARAAAWHRHPALFGVMLLPFGLLPLVKGSALLGVGSIGVLGLAALLAGGHRRHALLLAVVPVMACVGFWLVAGQPLASLPVFFINLLPIITGFTDAMSGFGPWREIAVFLLAALGILAAAALSGGESRRVRAFLVLAFALHLFLAFKAGFVRHDGHALMAGAALGMAGLLTLLLRSPLAPLAVVLGLSAWAYLDANHRNSSTQGLLGRAVEAFAAVPGGWAIRADGSIGRLAEQQRGWLAAECPLDRLEGSVDIYSYRQACLIVSGNRWSPRPVFQSYSAYTPRLAELNAAHLQGPRAPDHVLFRVEPIDDRLPALEDGPSWPALLQQYAPRKLDDDLVYLKRRPGVEEPRPQYGETRAVAVGEPVEVPPHDRLLMAQIELSRTLLGRLLSIAFKPTAPRIELVLAGGATLDYRLVPGMSAAGFLLSPHVGSTQEFVLVQEGSAAMAINRVRSLRVRVDNAGRWLWSGHARVRFAELAVAPSGTAIARMTMQPALAAAPFAGRVSQSRVCDGSIDRLNGLGPVPLALQTAPMLRLEGWTAVAHGEGRLAERVLLAVTGSDGKVTYFPTRVTQRPDVRDHFGQPGLLNSGFAATIDVGNLGPEIGLQLAHVSDGRLIHCEPVRKLRVVQ